MESFKAGCVMTLVGLFLWPWEHPRAALVIGVAVVTAVVWLIVR